MSISFKYNPFPFIIGSSASINDTSAQKHNLFRHNNYMFRTLIDTFPNHIYMSANHIDTFPFNNYVSRFNIDMSATHIDPFPFTHDMFAPETTLVLVSSHRAHPVTAKHMPLFPQSQSANPLKAAKAYLSIPRPHTQMATELSLISIIQPPAG
jgi:hypothetical protein